jgi:hypothetical protein
VRAGPAAAVVPTRHLGEVDVAAARAGERRSAGGGARGAGRRHGSMESSRASEAMVARAAGRGALCAGDNFFGFVWRG